MTSRSPFPPPIRDLDPATGECLAEIACAGPEQVQRAVDATREASRAWRRVPLATRIEQVQAVKEAILAQAEELATCVTREMGKPRTQALAEVRACCEIFDYYAAETPRFLEPREVSSGKRRSRILHEPVGVIGAITPWNFPVTIPMWTLVPGLMCGNGIVCKPSEIVPLTGERLHRAFASCLPEDLVTLVQGEDDTGRALVDSDVDMISFVGSRAVGKSIMAASAARLRPLALELGGKDPMLVLDDADLERAAEAAVWGSISNCGQVCCSVERIYVDRKIAATLEARIKEILAGVSVGNGLDDATRIGPMASAEQRSHVLRQIDDAVARGARLECGGRAIDGDGFFIQPTLLADTDESMEIIREETFGPVIALRPVDSAEEAVRLANDTPYGLGASVYSNDQARAEQIAAQLEAGTVGINRGTGSLLAAPWGGVKESGLGRLLGTAGLEEFTQTKVLHLS